MNYQLANSQEFLNNLGINEVPSEINMFYDLAYKVSTYIFDYRMNNNLTQKDLAEILGVKQAMISKLESGSYNISLETLCNVFAKLNTKVDIVFSEICNNDFEEYTIETNELINKDSGLLEVSA